MRLASTSTSAPAVSPRQAKMKSFNKIAQMFTYTMGLQVHRDRLPPMLDYDVQESIYRDKDGCVRACLSGVLDP